MDGMAVSARLMGEGGVDGLDRRWPPRNPISDRDECRLTLANSSSKMIDCRVLIAGCVESLVWSSSLILPAPPGRAIKRSNVHAATTWYGGIKDSRRY